MMNRRRITALVAGVWTTMSVGMNMLTPRDTLVNPLYDTAYKWHTLAFIEAGINDRCYDDDGHRVNALRIWDCEQRSLSMLKGAPTNSPIARKNEEIEAIPDLTTDPCAGQFLVRGDLKMDAAVTLVGRYAPKRDWFFTLFMPFYAMRLIDVSWCDMTTNTELKEDLTDCLSKYTRELGCLDICDWTRRGLGDLACMVDWLRDFPQGKEYLQNVRINARVGLTIPTGLKCDEDKIMAFSFGNDGCCTMPFGGGLTIMVRPHIILGVDVQLTHTFGNARLRRIKTDLDQTELLLLNKARAYRDYGLTQRFNLRFGVHRFWHGTSIRLGYQYIKHGDDSLALCTSEFSQSVANTSKQLEDWTMHHFVGYLENDFSSVMSPDSSVQPRLALFARVPFNGKRVAMSTNLGIMFSCDF